MRVIALAFASLAVVVSPILAAIITIDAAGGGDCLTIQEGLSVAAEGDTVLVVAGTYAGDGNRDLDFGTKNLVLTSKGGLSVTTIDLENAIGHRAIDFYDGGQDTTCVVKGFTIRDGYVNATYGDGAGIRCYAASPKIQNCLFESNRCSGNYGGAISCDNGSHLIIRDCYFVDNIAYRGGAVYCSDTSRPKFFDTTFTGNSGGDEGGAAYFGWQCDAQFKRCTFSDNITELAGGAVTCSRATPWFLNCSFIRNTGDVWGGAAHITSGSTPIFMNCTFVSNSGSEQGGTLHVNTGSYPNTWNCIFAFTAECDDSVIYVDASSDVDIQRCCSYGNAPGNTLPGALTIEYIISDPLFCDVTIDDLTLASTSPCLPGHNDWSADIGAYPQGCEESPVQRTSWSAIKAIYR